MKVYENGVYRDATAEEIAEAEAELKRTEGIVHPEERLKSIESTEEDLQEQIDLILSGAIK